MAKMVFEKFESKKSIEAINLYFLSRKKLIDELSNKDCYALQDSRFLSFAGFPLYVSEDGKSLTTDITKAKIFEAKKRKELKAFASSFQEEVKVSLDELNFLKVEIDALLSNY